MPMEPTDEDVWEETNDTETAIQDSELMSEPEFDELVEPEIQDLLSDFDIVEPSAKAEVACQD